MSAKDSLAVLDDRQRGVEVVAKATWRQFTAAYKLTVLREADTCTEPGKIGVLLRMYSSRERRRWSRINRRSRVVTAGLVPSA